jgi:hypothetical protein
MGVLAVPKVRMQIKVMGPLPLLKVRPCLHLQWDNNSETGLRAGKSGYRISPQKMTLVIEALRGREVAAEEDPGATHVEVVLQIQSNRDSISLLPIRRPT